MTDLEEKLNNMDEYPHINEVRKIIQQLLEEQKKEFIKDLEQWQYSECVDADDCITITKLIKSKYN